MGVLNRKTAAAAPPGSDASPNVEVFQAERQSAPTLCMVDKTQGPRHLP